MKKGFRTIGEILGIMIIYVFSMIIAGAIVPLSEKFSSFKEGEAETAFLMLLLVGFIMAVILKAILSYTSMRGFKLVALLSISYYGISTFMTQIETAYFIKAFPLLSQIDLLKFFIRGIVHTAIFIFGTAFVCGKMKKSDEESVFLQLKADKRLFYKIPAIAVIYSLLYYFFGYFVAWQFEDVRIFYTGSSELLSLIAQYAKQFSEEPSFIPFQLLRGVLWFLFGLPIFGMFKGNKRLTGVIAFVCFALWPTLQLAFPNILMPFTVRFAHFIEVSLSTGIFGLCCVLIFVFANKGGSNRTA